MDDPTRRARIQADQVSNLENARGSLEPADHQTLNVDQDHIWRRQLQPIHSRRCKHHRRAQKPNTRNRDERRCQDSLVVSKVWWSRSARKRSCPSTPDRSMTDRYEEETSRKRTDSCDGNTQLPLQPARFDRGYTNKQVASLCRRNLVRRSGRTFARSPLHSDSTS